MRFTQLLFALVLIGGEIASADPVLQATIANNQLMLLNKLSAMQKPREATNQLQTITFGTIMSGFVQGYSSKEIFEQAKMTNDPRLPQFNMLGAYKVNPAITAFLSPGNPETIAAKTAPTPESAQDIKIRMENEAAMKAASTVAPQVPEFDEKREMQRIYEQAELMRQRVREKVLKTSQ